jgi:hypothetical protein
MTAILPDASIIVCADCANPLWCRTMRACQECHLPSEAERRAAQQLRAELAFPMYQQMMLEQGIVQLSMGSPQNVTFTGTKAQWVALFEAIEDELEE